MTTIWQAIATQYVKRGWLLFWPRQFIDAGLDQGEVLRALKELVEKGKLREEFVLSCPDGHPAYTGSWQEVASRLGGPCPNPACDLQVDDEEAELRFEITPESRWDLDAGRAEAEKKTPLTP